MKPRQKRIKKVIKLCTKKKITKVSKKKCAHESCPCDIPKEIIFSQILSRLSFKFLCKLKCVSKEWCHIISYERHFMLQQSCCISAVPASYVCFNTNTLCIFPTCGNPAGIPDPSLMTILRNFNMESSGGIIALIASTNGLVCFMCGGLKNNLLVNPFHIVCNPATGESEFIPYQYHVEIDFSDVIVEGFGLAFDPSAIPASYKMVHVLLKHSHSTSKNFGLIFIYSSDTGRWITSEVHVPISSFEKLDKKSRYKKSVFVGGVIYWKLSREMVYYDLENDAANTLSLPRPNAQIYLEEIGQCGGCATLTRIIGTKLYFWMLLGYGHNPKWELMRRVRLEVILKHFSRGYWCLQPLPCNNDEEMIYIHVRWPKGKNELLSCDIKGGKVVSCGIFLVKEPNSTFQNWIFSYNNSLVVLPRKKAKNCPSPYLSKSILL